MKQLYIRLLVCFIALLIHSPALHAQQYQWVNGGGSTADLYVDMENDFERVLYMCTDLNGNIYALSNVNYYTVYAGGDTIDTYGGDNLLISSYNCFGQQRWAKAITSTDQDCYGYGIVCDNTGHIYVGGAIPGGTLHIGNDTTISSYSNEVLGVVQFDTSGHFNWITRTGDNSVTTYDSTFGIMYGGITLDSNENIHLIATIKSNVVLVSADTTHLGTYDLSYNVSGDLLSIKRLQLDSTLSITSASIDRRTNKLYSYGVDFLTSFDTARNQIWINTLGGGAAWGAVVPDGQGHLYTIADGDGYMVYKGDTISYPSYAAGGNIAAVLKLDTAGNLKWVSQINSNYAVGYLGLALSPNNKLCATGGFVDEMNARTITGATITYGDVWSQTIFSILDTAGNILNVVNAGGSSDYDAGYSVTSDKVGNFYIGGEVANCIPSDSVITPYCSVGGNTDFFVLKYGVDCGCTSMPVCNYSVTGTTTITATYTGSTTPAIDSVVWSFGDSVGGVSTVGATYTGLTATHVYTTIGTVNLCATVYTGCGSDIHCHPVLVNCATTTIAAAFTDTGSTVRGFTYTGTAASADSVDWKFGDGGTATGLTAIHSYTASGTYTVCVTVHTACGSNTSCSTISVDCTPAASFSYSGSSPVSFTYTGSTIGVSGITWDYGDGTTGSGATAAHVYSTSGTYEVCVTNHTSCGEKTACESIIVDCIPVAAFTDTGSTIIGFTYTGTTPSIDSIVWSFGDGSTGTGSAITHFYATTGTYTVCVTAYGLCGSNTICQTVSANCTPVASYTYSGISTITFDFTGFPTTAADGLDSVLWIFGDGPTATGLTAVHSYSTTGSFTACAEVFSSCGSNMSCQYISVPCLANASFTYNVTGSSLATFNYTGTTTDVDSVVWYFGDGTTDTGLNPQHTYADTNVYNVCVVLYSACGVDSSCSEVPVGVEGVPVISNTNIQVFPNPTTTN